MVATLGDPVDERLLVRAAGPGGLRDAALTYWTRARQTPERAGHWLRAVQRQRKLHSRERRFVSDGLFGLVRNEGGLRFAVGHDDPLALWLGWLVLHGLDPSLAAAQHDGEWETFVARWNARLEGADAALRLWRAHAMPQTMAEWLIGDMGPVGAEAFCRASDQRAPIGLRANLQKCDRETLQAALATEGITTRLSPHTPTGLVIDGRAALTATKVFQQGWVEVQDEASQRVANLLGDAQTVIDLCAGAGGKSLAMAAHGVRVVAHDVRGRALDALKQRARRAGARIRIERNVERLGQADAVLVDAPCGGSGVLRRHPEHRWHTNTASMGAWTSLQAKLLRRAVRHVSPGGRLVYATCSVLAQENGDVVDRFLAECPDWRQEGDRVSTRPDVDGVDGFFATILRSP